MNHGGPGKTRSEFIYNWKKGKRQQNFTPGKKIKSRPKKYFLRNELKRPRGEGFLGIGERLKVLRPQKGKKVRMDSNWRKKN